MAAQSTTVRGLVHDIQVELRPGPADLLPGRAARMLTELSALLGNINDEIREADVEYSCVLLAELEKEQAANRAKIRAETSVEYVRKREARDTKELALEMIRSLKYFLRSQEEEMRLSR